MDRFYSKVNTNGDCHIWTAGKDAKGYGRFTLNGRQEQAHRVAFLLHHRCHPVGQVNHHCDNPSCVNPAHLYDGTKADNARDMMQRHRWARHTKLNPDAVKEIRAMIAAGHKLRAIARRFGVHPSLIDHIKAGRSWKHS